MDVRKLYNAVRYYGLDAQAVRDLIEDRFYPSELAKVSNPVYPCANLEVLQGHAVGRTKETFDGTLQIWGWSTDGYDEASKILNTLETQLANARIEAIEMFAVLTIRLTAQQLYDETAKAYGYVMRYDVFAIER